MSKEEKIRFQLELEFVQCLANPQYLQFLAQQQYFTQPAFINYLEYLKYWQKPEYASFIIYPYCLELLDLLQHTEFREKVAHTEVSLLIHRKEFTTWQFNSHRKVLMNDDGVEESMGDLVKKVLSK